MDIVNESTAPEQPTTPSAAWLEFDADPPIELLAAATAIYGSELVTKAVRDVGRKGRLRDYDMDRFIALRSQAHRLRHGAED